MKSIFHGRLGLQQRVLPSYRGVFFNTLGRACSEGLSIFAGKPLENEGIVPIEILHDAKIVQASNHYFFNPGSALFLCWQSGFLNWLESWQPDALVVEANPRYVATRLAIKRMHQYGRPVIGWGLGSPPIPGLFGNLRQWERVNFLSSLDAIIAYSQRGAEQYYQLGANKERIYVAFNAVDPAPTAPFSPRPSEYHGQPTILYVGRLQKRKRVDLLIQACAGLPKELQPRVLIVGDGPARGEFENLAREIYPETEFTGTKIGEELEPFFNQSDLFVLPGTGGLAIQQAMAHGLPIIVAQGDGTQDDLVREENGWIISGDNHQALTDLLRQALSDPEKLRRMGNASFRIVSEEINVDKMVEVFIKVLNDLTQQR